MALSRSQDIASKYGHQGLTCRHNFWVFTFSASRWVNFRSEPSNLPRISRTLFDVSSHLRPKVRSPLQTTGPGCCAARRLEVCVETAGETAGETSGMLVPLVVCPPKPAPEPTWLSPPSMAPWREDLHCQATMVIICQQETQTLESTKTLPRVGCFLLFSSQLFALTYANQTSRGK